MAKNLTNHPFYVTERDKLKYRDQFKALGPKDGHVTGAQAKGFFLQSQLPPKVLGEIWALADRDADGQLDFNEFSIACKLINLKLRGMEVPKVLPNALLESLLENPISLDDAPAAAAAAPPIASTAIPRPVAPIAATMPGAVPAVPGLVPGSLPGVVPQTVPTVSPAAPLVPTLPTVTTAGMPLQGLPMTAPGIPGVMPGMIPAGGVGVLPPAVVGAPPMAMPVVGGSAPIGIMPGVQPTQVPVALPGMVPGMTPLPGMAPQPVGLAGVTLPGPIVTQPRVVSPPSGEPKVASTPTPPTSNPPSRSMSISERAPSIESPQGEWAIKGAAKRKYTMLFNATDRARSGYLSGVQVRSILLQSKLPQATLAQVWTLSDLDCDGRLSCDEFCLIMFLCDKAINGEKIPTTLPLDWIPPSYRKSKSRQGSVSGPVSRAGSQPASRHASVSSQGAIDGDPSAGLPQSTFEDKRKENFDKGQAELDRRRKLLQDQQRKEKEERERKEREESEKREKARIEAERKQQEELERQLQKQRERELEIEEQRKRELEAKEAARKELEKQRQLEWEQARIAELNAQKQREQERVLKQKAHNTTLNIQLSDLNEKIKDLSQKICDTRAGVTNVKSVIDGMRSQRDNSMAEMSQLKQRIKVQNAKLLQLTQERAKWDAKAKTAGMSSEAAQEQLNAAFTTKQLSIKQLKDKLENLLKDIESKKEDINSNNEQMNEVKEELAALIVKCQELYNDYDKQRNQVLELKYNKKNENVSTSVSAWDNQSSSTGWGTSIDQYGGISNEAPTAVSAVGVGVGGGNRVKYRALYEFVARTIDEISFAPDDIITYAPLEHDTNAEPGWLRGEINGHAGYFPESYVEKIEGDYGAVTEEPVAAIDYGVQDTYNDNTQSADAYTGSVEYYIAAYPYESTESGDLSFNAGEMIMVIKKEGEWWTGTIGNRTGMFPSNYVQKADVGTANTVAAIDEQKDNNVNGNAQIPYDAPAAEPITTTTTVTPDITQQNDTLASATIDNITAPPSQAPPDTTTIPTPTSATATSTTVSAEETRTNEELDTEVSQINTQSKNQTDTSESYSRPMSRTSSMTPGMRAKRSEIAQVIAPYEATSSEQLSLTRGQLIMIRKKTDTGWWEGELQAKGRRRQIGWFPATYVKVLQGGRNSGRNTPVSGSRIEMTEQILDKVIALYPYKAQNDDELSFDKDDIISVLGRDEPEWWRGELNGISGLFPSNYVGPFVTSGNV